MKNCTNLLVALFLLPALLFGQSKKTAKSGDRQPSGRIEKLKQEAVAAVEANTVMAQQINDMLFSFSELGFQEEESFKYLTNLLEKEGFTVKKGISGIPTAWIATWGSGKPLIAVGSDIDCIPKASQKPGVAYKDPIVEGAPGHGEGHNSGQALNIVAVLAVKKLMEREKIPGTLMLWPGVAEELVGTKAFYVRDGYFKDVDACIFTHVGNNLAVSWGDNGNNGLVSVKFNFEGQAAHAAGAPWRGRSALDAVELMNIGWNYRREHLELTQRSHYVISDGGDQPNVVPSKAAVWYYFRERTYPKIKKLFETGVKIAEGAAMMTDTKFTYEILGSAWPVHTNRVIAAAAYDNIKKVGLPTWSEEDQLLARASQIELQAPKAEGLAVKLDSMGMPTSSAPVVMMGGQAMTPMGGGSDDIADISWSLPTIVLRYPSNIPGLPGHHWANAISMATPIAHKGVVYGAKAEAMTLLDLLLKPEIIKDAWAYYKDEQTKDIKYEPLISPKEQPAIYLNKKIMAEFKPKLEKFYYDPSKYKTYLEQLGIKYPTVRDDQRTAVKKQVEKEKSTAAKVSSSSSR
ncbi:MULTISPECIES: peptidase dimerization domain-containing protein [Spirosoma]|uniref:Peptidase dimerization domain-containing protein n=1 Tax=Spirosoma liriopis TaxID=2937440 RepID=A0ABT0HKB3_9BACT|nr:MULTISPECIES: peptidase dimerization domain-containing protein [Spirosoma]MCK8492415.1 peptidase dimerization domain-containing protein [Spirosoma liriopis]UHG91888.1 peptidase dimerization domain-containing protein [Spirosoma oryzicola]